MAKTKKQKNNTPDPIPGSRKEITPKQELFCNLYSTDEECFGNGTKAYQRAYECNYDSARDGAARLLANTCICGRINELMDSYINETMVDAEMAKVIKQSADLGAKVRAAHEWNMVKGRITQKMQLSGSIGVGLKPLKPNDETYKEIIREEAKRLGLI